MKSRVFSAVSPAEVESQLKSICDDGFRPALAIVFSSIIHDLNEIAGLFASRDIQVFGASSSGEITGGELYEGSISVMLLDMDRSAFQLNIFESSGDSSMDAGRRAAGWARGVFSDPAMIVMASGLQTDGEKLVNGILDESGRQMPLFGCLAGDDLRLKETFVFDSQHVFSCGVIALALDRSAIDLKGTAVSGWKGVGVRKVITRASGNRVYTIDGEPALDVYRKYLGVSKEDDIQVAVEFPILIERDDGTFVLRAITMIHDDNSISYAGSVAEGARARFSLPISTETIEHTIQQMEGFHERNPEAEAIIVFDCKSRHVALGPLIEDEIAPIGKLWNAPVTGFLTYGEIGSVTGGCSDFHNHTISLVLIASRHEKPLS